MKFCKHCKYVKIDRYAESAMMDNKCQHPNIIWEKDVVSGEVTFSRTNDVRVMYCGVIEAHYFE